MLTYCYVEALNFASGSFCCDRHPETNFQLRDFFQGQFLYQDGSQLFYGAEDDMKRKDITNSSKTSVKRPLPQKTRKVKDRKELKTRLYAWRKQAHENDYLSSVRPSSFILDDTSIKLLTTLHPTNIQNTTQLVLAINETSEWEDEWSKKVLEVIHSYDQELQQSQKTAIAAKKDDVKRRRKEMDLAGFQAETDNLRASTERRLRESAAQGFSRFANRLTN